MRHVRGGHPLDAASRWRTSGGRRTTSASIRESGLDSSETARRLPVDGGACTTRLDRRGRRPRPRVPCAIRSGRPPPTAAGGRDPVEDRKREARPGIEGSTSGHQSDASRRDGTLGRCTIPDRAGDSPGGPAPSRRRGHAWSPGSRHRDLLAIPDAALERRWTWLPSDIDEIDVRYGIYRIHESLESAIAAITYRPRRRASQRLGPAVPALQAMAVARWELHGALAPLSDADWDADPGADEWTVRQTSATSSAGQRSMAGPTPGS
jgi:hypothetical protein